MNYIIEIINNDNEIIDTKKAYTIEEIKAFYLENYKNYAYRLYEHTDMSLLIY